MFTMEDILYDYIYPKIKDTIIESPELNKLYDHFSSVDILPFKENSKSFSQVKFKSEYELSYISKDIQKKIEKYNTKYSVILNMDNYTICINIFSDNNILNTNFLHELKKYIQFTLSLHPLKTNITINYHLSDEKKMIKEGILTTNEINSGSCMILSDNSIINIWRKEEILKVTIHELFHALKYDSYKDNEEIIQHYTNKYDTSSTKINTHEAFAEIWANLINCFLISQKYNNENKKVFRELVTIEKFYSIFQAQKVLFNSLTKKGVNNDKNTNVTAYFLIRAELYQRLNAFLKFCRLNNGNYVKIKNTENWLVFLKSKNKIKRNTIFKGEKGYLFKNLRMTILELNLLN